MQTVLAHAQPYQRQRRPCKTHRRPPTSSRLRCGPLVILRGSRATLVARAWRRSAREVARAAWFAAAGPSQLTSGVCAGLGQASTRGARGRAGASEWVRARRTIAHPCFSRTKTFFLSGSVMPPCALNRDLTDEALWTVSCPACRVDGMPQPNRWSARTPGRKHRRPGR